MKLGMGGLHEAKETPWNLAGLHEVKGDSMNKLMRIPWS